MVSQMLHIPSGVVSVMGSGGKTTLLSVLAQELSGSVILCTTTHMFPFPQYPLLPGDDAGEIQAALSASGWYAWGGPMETASSPPLFCPSPSSVGWPLGAGGGRRL